MIYIIRFIGSFMLFCFFSHPAIVYANLTGKDLLENCEVKLKLSEKKPTESVNSTEAFQAGACTGYIKGFDDMEIIYASIIAGPSSNEADVKKYSLYCLPTGTTNLQMATIIVKYIKDHPAELNDDASLAAAKAFREAFACPKK